MTVVYNTRTKLTIKKIIIILYFRPTATVSSSDLRPSDVSARRFVFEKGWQRCKKKKKEKKEETLPTEEGGKHSEQSLPNRYQTRNRTESREHTSQTLS